MVNQKLFDQSARSDFNQNGFVVIRRYQSTEEAQRLRNEVERYIAKVLPALSSEAAFYEDKQRPESLMRLERMDRHDTYFDQLLRNDCSTTLAEILLDDKAIPRDAAMFAKAPQIGTPTPPHQDGFYFKIEPNEALTIWIPIDPVDETNGCVRYVPGSHRRGLRHHEVSGVFGFSLGITDHGGEDQRTEVPVCLQPGDAVIHHSLTIHRTDANRTDCLRRAIGLVYYAKRSKKDLSAAEHRQKSIYKQWKENGRL